MEILETISARIDALFAEKDRVIVAIDGNCTAGKTTLAARLDERYDCNVLHMDDFFLRPQQRTPARYDEAGGNVDYERFYGEVLLPLRSDEAFSYRPFDCKTMTLTDPVTVVPKALTIIEGTYSLHPYFGDPYDLKILLTIPPEVQRARILQRPAFLHQPFFEKWIPMENRYLEQHQIARKCDYIF